MKIKLVARTFVPSSDKDTKLLEGESDLSRYEGKVITLLNKAVSEAARYGGYESGGRSRMYFSELEEFDAEGLKLIASLTLPDDADLTDLWKQWKRMGIIALDEK